MKSSSPEKEVLIPSLEQLENERKRIKYTSRYGVVLRSTIFTLIVVAAAAVLVSTLWLPFLRIYGSSMAPTLEDGQIICCVKTKQFERGEMIAFYYNNKILVKRVIGTAGDVISIDDVGVVTLNGEALKEPYVRDLALGDCNIEFPFTVPNESYFVMGDHRSTSVDSRHTTVGCVSGDQIVGKLLLRLWPMNEMYLFREAE